MQEPVTANGWDETGLYRGFRVHADYFPGHSSTEVPIHNRSGFIDAVSRVNGLIQEDGVRGDMVVTADPEVDNLIAMAAAIHEAEGTTLYLPPEPNTRAEGRVLRK